MKTRIIVYSHTGHTLAVARSLKEFLDKSGFQTDLEQIEPCGPINLRAESVPIMNIPEVRDDDALIFASPVHGGRISAPMRTYLNDLGSLKGKKTICLVTHFLFPEWGREQVFHQMHEICASKGANVLGCASIWRLKPNRQREIKKAVEYIHSLFMH